MSPDVSVIVPYRDAADTIDEALDSVCAQGGVAVEVIAVDDGSRDDGPARAARYPVRHVRGGEGGLVAALRAGLAAARADVIARMDADDVCLPGRLAAQVEALRAAPRLGVIGARVEAFPADAVAEGLRLYVDWQNGLITPEDHARELFVESPLCHPSVAIRRAALDAVGGWRETGGPEDYDLWLRLDAAGWELAKLPDVLLRWRHRPGRATFADPRCAHERFVDAKAPHLARRVTARGRPLVMWGAGRAGKRLARALEACGVRPALFVDIDANKIGREARGRPIVEADALRAGEHTVVAAVRQRGARDEIRAELRARGFIEGDDFLCAA